MSILYTDNIKALDAVTVDTTSDFYDFSKRQRITATIQCASHTAGNGIFTVDACNGDPSVSANWITGIAVKNAVTTNATTLVTLVTLSANGTSGIIIPVGFKYYRIGVDLTTDGAYTAVFEAIG